VFLWAHVDVASEWLRRVTVAAPDLLPYSANMLEERLVAFDLTRPVDVAFSANDDGTMDFAMSVRVRNEDLFVRTMAAFGPLDRNGGYYVREAAKNATPAKSATAAMRIDVCELEAEPMRAVCGTRAGVARMGAWLRTAPSAPRGDLYMELTLAPLHRMVETVSSALDGKGQKASDLKKLLADTESLVVYARDAGSGQLDGGIDLTLKDRSGAVAAALFASAQKGGTSASLVHHLAVPGGMVATSNGGDGPSTLYLRWLVADSPPAAREAWSAAEALAARPHALLFRVDTTLVQKALEGARVSRGEAGATAALGAALGGFVVVASEAEIGEVKAAVRAVHGIPTKSAKAPGAGRYLERGVAAAYLLPKEAFFVDKVVGETSKRAGSHGDPARRATLLAFPYEGVTYLILGRSEDESFVKVANEIRATRYMIRRADTASLPALALSGTVDPRFATLRSEAGGLKPSQETWKRIAAELVAAERQHLEYRVLAREVDGKPRVSAEVTGPEREMLTTYFALVSAFLSRDR